MDTAIDFAFEQASGFENTEMLGDGGKGEWERLGEFGDGGFALGEAGENGAACGIGECGEGCVERRGEIVNHMVKYGLGASNCQANSSNGKMAAT